ncbi:outer membrane protein [Novosphingobium humi]|nr:outer membrane beta-barrel protein [Novosphingobium humi]WJS97792.1 outer membrane beta-barrel protein [Novosphingobium humi]
MFKEIMFASALALAVATPALAQNSDGPIRWDGPYIGVNVGLGSSTLKYPLNATIHTSTATTLSGEARQSSSGVIGGGHLGYNIATSGLVLGLEADIMASDVKGETSLSGSAGGGASGTASIGAVSSIDYLGTVRARVGAPMMEGRFMPFVTGGFAYGRVRTKLSGAISGALAGSTSPVNLAGGNSYHSDQTGWVLGAGADYALTRNLIFRAEYLYTDLGTNTITNRSLSLLGTAIDADVRMKTTANILRVGMSYRF